MSHQIYTLSVHDPNGQTLVIEEGHEEEGLRKIKQDTRLTAFFKLCAADPNASDLTYDKLPYRYRYVFICYSIFKLLNQYISAFILSDGITKVIRGLNASIHWRRTLQKQKCL